MHLITELLEPLINKKQYLVRVCGIALITPFILVLINQFSLLPLPIPKEGIGWGHSQPAINPRSKEAFQEAIKLVHRHGIGFEDPNAAGAPFGLEEVLKMAVERGHSNDPDAEYLIGWMFESHECVDLEYVEIVDRITRTFDCNWLSYRRLHLATQWYQRACEHGSIPAAAELGYMYEEGFGVPVNYYLAAKWYQKAAGAGDGQAQLDLERMYQNGLGMKTDPEIVTTLKEEGANGNILPVAHQI